MGIGAGIGSWLLARPLGTEWLERATGFVSPFGTVLISMLKMAVIPIIFFSLVTGAASLPLKKFGKLGLAVGDFRLEARDLATQTFLERGGVQKIAVLAVRDHVDGRDFSAIEGARRDDRHGPGKP